MNLLYTVFSLIEILKEQPIFLLGIPIFYTTFSLILKKNFEKRTPFENFIFIIGYLSTLIWTALIYEILPTPIAIIILPIVIILWKIQISIIKRIFLKQKNTYIYWLWNITSPKWTLWINGYQNEGSGSHNYWGFTLYIIGSICLTMFVLKKSSFRLECEKLTSEKKFV